jgi:hypothetical protein
LHHRLKEKLLMQSQIPLDQEYMIYRAN